MNNIDSSDIIGLNIIKRQKSFFNINENEIKDDHSESFSEDEIIKYSSCYGGSSNESKLWDDYEEIGEKVLLNSKVIKIKIFLGKYKETIIINGIGYSYKNLITGEITNYEHRGSNDYIDFKDNDWK